jgi:hypothetical protein
MERGDPAVCNVSFNREGKDEMIKASIDLQDLRRRLYVKAKAETSWRFWGLVCCRDTKEKKEGRHELKDKCRTAA